MRTIGWALALLLACAGSAAAADLPLGAFYGKWQGSALSESQISSYFRLSSRDIGVEIRAAGEGFTLTWNTVLRQRGDPRSPTEELRSNTLTFVPARRPGLWVGQGNADPVQGGRPFFWAYVQDNTLVVQSLQVADDGGSELQVYRRTLTGNGMELEFTRTLDGEAARRAKGRLIKLAN
ncbi:MAG: hypothetical protein FJX68_00410 [Alphaproteobacteria bacterium]|nr:hypothetical protein [Alphaproteobacteria bacterium]